MTDSRSLIPEDAAGRAAVKAAVKDQAEQLLAQRGGGLFPADMTPVQAVALAKLAVRYGLDPFAEELTIFQGKPYFGLKGTLRIANEHPMYRGFECRPGTDEERTAFRVGQTEHFWVATVYRKDRDYPIVNFGRAGGAGDRNALRDSFGPELARKRAVHRAHRDAFALPALGIEEAPASVDRMPAAPVDASDVWDIEDGDVVDGDVIDFDAIDFDAPPHEIRADQIKAIHAAATSLGWSEEVYRQALRDCFGFASSLELTENQASAFLEVMMAEEEAARAEQRRVRLPAGWLTAAMRRLAGEDRDDPPLSSPMPPAAEIPPEGAPVAASPSDSAAGGKPPDAGIRDADIPGSMALAQQRTIAQETKRLGYTDLQLAGFCAHRYGGRTLEQLSYAQAEDLANFLTNSQRRDPKPIGGKEAGR
jgi:hypothetical protein